MYILLLGKYGQLGWELQRTLAPLGDILALDFPQIDLEQVDSLRELIHNIRPQVIFNATAYTAVDRAESEMEIAQAINSHAPRVMAEEAKKIGAAIIHYSTDYVFDGSDGPYDEGAQPSPVSVYGKSKLEAEKTVQTILKDALILRTTVVFGWDRSSKNFAMQVYHELQAGKPMRVPEDQFGNPTLVDYLAEASVRLFQQGTHGVVNVVGKDLLSRADFGKALAKVFGLDPALVQPVATSALQQRAQRPLRGGLKTEKLSQLLGIQAMPLEEALKRLRRQWRADV